MNVFCLVFEGKQLLPLSSSVHSSVGQVTWQSTGEASNLVRMRNQSLGQSAPSLTAGLVSVYSVKIWGSSRNESLVLIYHIVICSVFIFRILLTFPSE